MLPMHAMMQKLARAAERALGDAIKQPQNAPIRRELSAATKEIRQIRHIRGWIERTQGELAKAELEVIQLERLARARIVG